MPASRSAKEICREHGDDSISCKVATKREARRKRRDEEYGETEAPKPDKPVQKKPPKKPTKPATERRKYLEEKIREAEGGKPPNKS